MKSEANQGHAKTEKIATGNLTRPLANYSHARRVGPVLYVAGQGCRDSKTNAYAGVSFLPDGSVAHVDVAAQTRGVLDNVEAVLTSQGLSRADLVDIQVFLTDMADFARMNDVWNHFFADVPSPPTRTTVAVSALPGLNRVEMKCVAQCRDV